MSVKKPKNETWWQKKLKEQEAKIKELSDNPAVKEALEYYANKETYLFRGSYNRYRNIDNDKGHRARVALGLENA